MIERFYDPLEGSVLIDGSDIKSYNLRKLRSYIALVSQEPTLFAGTIRENIAYGTEDDTEYEVRKAAMLAYAHEFIRYVYIYLLFILIQKSIASSFFLVKFHFWAAVLRVMVMIPTVEKEEFGYQEARNRG